MGMYVPNKTACPSTTFTDVEEIKLIASERSSVDPNWQYQYGLAGYYLIGYWDVDKGGAQGYGGSTGANKMFMYVKPFESGKSSQKMVDLQLRVHSSSTIPSSPSPAYVRPGYWDVDGAKGDTLSKGTDGSKGHYYMALYIKYDYNY